MKRITLTEIAKKAGVSQPLVSKVLCGAKGSQWVSKEVEQKIKDIAKKLGYRPNLAARATATGRFNMIALLQSTLHHRSIMSESLLEGIQDELEKHNMHLVLAKLPDEELIKDGMIPKIFNELMCDGLLINYNSEIPPEMEKLVNDSSLPAVWINSKHDFNCVYPDDYRAAGLITEEMQSLGHKNIAYLDYSDGKHFSNKDRLDGYKTTMEKQGLKPNLLLYDARWDMDKMLENCRNFLSKPDRPTAVIAYTSSIIWMVHQVAGELGIKIPAELSIASFHDKPDCHIKTHISTMVLPENKMGMEAVRMLCSILDGKAKKYDPLPVEFTFFKQDTFAQVLPE